MRQRLKCSEKSDQFSKKCVVVLTHLYHRSGRRSPGQMHGRRELWAGGLFGVSLLLCSGLHSTPAWRDVNTLCSQRNSRRFQPKVMKCLAECNQSYIGTDGNTVVSCRVKSCLWQKRSSAARSLILSSDNIHCSRRQYLSSPPCPAVSTKLQGCVSILSSCLHHLKLFCANWGLGAQLFLGGGGNQSLVSPLTMSCWVQMEALIILLLGKKSPISYTRRRFKALKPNEEEFTNWRRQMGSILPPLSCF